jgi:hypothetical protein
MEWSHGCSQCQQESQDQGDAPETGGEEMAMCGE